MRTVPPLATCVGGAFALAAAAAVDLLTRLSLRALATVLRAARSATQFRSDRDRIDTEDDGWTRPGWTMDELAVVGRWTFVFCSRNHCGRWWTRAGWTQLRWTKGRGWSVDWTEDTRVLFKNSLRWMVDSGCRWFDGGRG